MGPVASGATPIRAHRNSTRRFMMAESSAPPLAVRISNMSRMSPQARVGKESLLASSIVGRRSRTPGSEGDGDATGMTDGDDQIHRDAG